jgi:Cu+-exporting ATPase
MNAKEVTLLRGNEEVIAPIEHLQVGQHFVLRPGDRVPADGIVVSGKSTIDNSHITGESIPIEISAGSEVVSGAINLTSRLVVQAQRVGRDSELSRITQMVLTAQSEKAPVQQLADRISAVFVPVVVTAALATFIIWYGFDFGTLQQAVTAAVSLLVIACPCALGLATPVALLVASGSGARKGIVLRKVRAIEIASKIDTVIFDKTGTLTTGKMTVQKTVMAAHNHPLSEVLSASYAIAQASNHPVAGAIARYCLATLGSTGSDAGSSATGSKKLVDFTESAGAGLASRIAMRGSDGQSRDLPVLLGSAHSIAKATLSLPKEISLAVEEARNRGNSISILAVDGAALLAFEVGDSLRPDSEKTVRALHEKGIQTWLISGDSHQAVSAISSAVGMDPSRTIAEASPAAKIAKIKEIRGQGHRVLMVGDGVNDAAALAEADLSMAMGTGTDTAIATADITLVRPELGAVKDALNLSARTLRTIRGNLGWAFIYNVIGIPVAALGLLNPMIAGAAMATSSLFVVMNSLRLRQVLR